jgi:hypothetical protein
MGKRKIDYMHYESFESETNQGRYSRISASMQRSEAWKQLKPIAVKLYVYLKLKFWGKEHKIKFICTYKEINQHIRLNDKSIKSAYDDLIKKGFIIVVENNQSRMKSNKYKFSEHWKLYNSPRFEYIESQREVVIKPLNINGDSAV